MYRKDELFLEWWGNFVVCSKVAHLSLTDDLILLGMLSEDNRVSGLIDEFDALGGVALRAVFFEVRFHAGGDFWEVPAEEVEAHEVADDDGAFELGSFWIC